MYRSAGGPQSVHPKPPLDVQGGGRADGEFLSRDGGPTCKQSEAHVTAPCETNLLRAASQKRAGGASLEKREPSPWAEASTGFGRQHAASGARAACVWRSTQSLAESAQSPGASTARTQEGGVLPWRWQSSCRIVQFASRGGVGCQHSHRAADPSCVSHAAPSRPSSRRAGTGH